MNLDAMAPSEYATKLVEYLGDTDRVLELAKQDFEDGQYQWVAEITNALVFCRPRQLEARYLCADALEQLGYQAESGPWRNAYLSGALELREGSYSRPEARANGMGAIKMQMTTELDARLYGHMPGLRYRAGLECHRQSAHNRPRRTVPAHTALGRAALSALILSPSPQMHPGLCPAPACSQYSALTRNR